MPGFHLAQFNVAVMRQPLDSPAMAEFMGNLARINALADASPGFVWRLATRAGDATALRPLGEDTIVNLSVWRDLASLERFVYDSGHAEIMWRRREWFERMAQAHLALWWVAEGHRPTLEEAVARLAHLREHGPSARAFSWRSAFLAPVETALDSTMEG